jgi:hypothetical protein
MIEFKENLTKSSQKIFTLIPIQSIDRKKLSTNKIDSSPSMKLQQPSVKIQFNQSNNDHPKPVFWSNISDTNLMR